MIFINLHLYIAALCLVDMIWLPIFLFSFFLSWITDTSLTKYHVIFYVKLWKSSWGGHKIRYYNYDFQLKSIHYFFLLYGEKSVLYNKSQLRVDWKYDTLHIFNQLSNFSFDFWYKCSHATILVDSKSDGKNIMENCISICILWLHF